MAVDGDDAGVAAEVAELVVVGAGEDFAAEAAHETDALLRGGDGVIVEVLVVGARGGSEGIGVVGVEVGHRKGMVGGHKMREREREIWESGGER